VTRTLYYLLPPFIRRLRGCGLTYEKKCHGEIDD